MSRCYSGSGVDIMRLPSGEGEYSLSLVTSSHLDLTPLQSLFISHRRRRVRVRVRVRVRRRPRVRRRNGRRKRVSNTLSASPLVLLVSSREPKRRKEEYPPVAVGVSELDEIAPAAALKKTKDRSRLTTFFFFFWWERGKMLMHRNARRRRVG